MKKNYLLILMLFSTFFAVAQNPLRSIESWNINSSGKSTLKDKSWMEYDNNGNEISRHISNWDPSNKTFIPSFNIHKEFNEDNLITHYLYEGLGEHGLPIVEIHYQYQNACFQKITHDRRNGFSFSRTITYYNPEDCLIDSIGRYYSRDGFDSLEKTEFEEHIRDGNIETQTKYCLDSLNQFTIACFQTVLTRNDQEQIIRLDVNTGFESELYLRDYDDKGNMIFESKQVLTSNDEWEIVGETSVSYSYNSSDDLARIDANLVSYTGGLVFFVTTETVTYSYDCDGLLSEKLLTRSLGSSTLTLYQYEDGHTCDLTEEEDLLSIRPNFTQGYVLLESEILESENSQISVYDMNGQLLSQYKPGRVQLFHLDLRDLPAGNYVIHVFNKNYSATERVIKM